MQSTIARRAHRIAMTAGIVMFATVTVAFALSYDQNAYPDYFAGSGNVNGAFTVDRSNGVELALRAKLRFDSSCLPQNIFNSNGDGSYTFDAIDRVGCSGWADGDTPEWNFEWSINTDYDGTTGLHLADLTYVISFDADPGLGTSSLSFDPIHVPFADHALGNNSTMDGINEAKAKNPPDDPSNDYGYLITVFNVAQNSWNYDFFDGGTEIDAFDAEADGVYDVSLSAYDGSTLVASTTIQVVVGNPLLDANQCKKGGWAGFGFRNQGQCIRYVNTGKDSR